jgi:hypothetical protein
MLPSMTSPVPPPGYLGGGSLGDRGFHFLILFATEVEYLFRSFAKRNSQLPKRLLPQQPLLHVQGPYS